ncbi:DNA-binding FrmR family transcriptional regulator [Arthrobacter sp. MP_M7]|nr:DNA-binding FrmR family transcriptional regulator [Arthrobacter sp. MP_M4]MEC5202159.1 DNA-binding FrmR family transcriptional regulator [Arthrobacter sp. MP_M7]
MLEERGCKDIATGLAAVSKAPDRAGFAIIASSLEQCLIIRARRELEPDLHSVSPSTTVTFERSNPRTW